LIGMSAALPPDHFEECSDCAFFRPVGNVTLEEATQQVREAITFARERGVPRLLINLLGFSGYASPTLAERYFISREWAAAARNCVKAAIVVPVEILDPEKFGVTVARNTGMDADVFTAESEALVWLLSGPTR